MNEEIVVRFGADNRPLARGLRGLKGMIQDAKKELSLGGIGEALKGGLAGLGVALGTAELIRGAKDAMEFAKNIETLGEQFDVTTDFLQQFELAAERNNSTSETADKGLAKLVEKLGQAREGNKEAADAFERNGIAIADLNGNALSTQEVFDAFTKRIVSIEDPALRAATAADFLGEKIGSKLVPALMKLEEVKANSDGAILSKEDISTLHIAGEEVDSMWKKLKTFGASALAKVLAPALEPSIIRNGRGDGSQSGSKLGPTEADIKQAKEYAEALDAVRSARRDLVFAGSDDQNTLLKLLSEEGDLQRKYNSEKDGTVEKLKTEKAILEKNKEIEEAKKKLSKDQTDQVKKHNEELKKQQHYQEELRKATRAHDDAARSLKEGFQDRSKFTVGELADQGRDKFNRGQFETRSEMTAVDIENLERRAKEARNFGNGKFADDLQTRADKLRKGLSGVLTSSESDPMRGLKEGVDKTAQALEDIVKNGVSVKDDE